MTFWEQWDKKRNHFKMQIDMGRFWEFGKENFMIRRNQKLLKNQIGIG